MSRSSNDDYVLVPRSQVLSSSTSSSSTVSTGSGMSLSLQPTLNVASPTVLNNTKMKLKPLTRTFTYVLTGSLTTSVKELAWKIDASSAAGVSSCVALYDEFRYDSVKFTHFNTIADQAQSTNLGVGAIGVDVNADGGSAITLAGLLNMAHRTCIEWGNMKKDTVSCKFDHANSASGQWPAWQKCSQMSSFWPGCVVLSAVGLPGATLPLALTLDVTISFRTKQ